MQSTRWPFGRNIIRNKYLDILINEIHIKVRNEWIRRINGQLNVCSSVARIIHT